MHATYHSGSLDRFFDSRLCVSQLLRDLPSAAVEAFDFIKRMRAYLKGSIIFAEGQPPQGVYVLGQGRAKLVLDLNRKREQIVRLVEPGEILG